MRRGMISLSISTPPTETGTAMTSAMIEVESVPTIRGTTP